MKSHSTRSGQRWALALAGALLAAWGCAGGGTDAPVVAAEICNGLDDNANGAIDEGIPWLDVAFPGAVTQIAESWAGSVLPGGTAFEDACPAGQVLIGIWAGAADNGSGSTVLHSVQPNCGDPVVFCSGDTCGVTVAAGDYGTVHGNGAVSRTAAMCPTDQVVVGFSGATGNEFDQIVLRCAPLEATPPGTDWVVAASATSADIPRVGGPGGAPFGPFECSAGEAATGIWGRSGSWLNSFSLSCQAPAKLCMP